MTDRERFVNCLLGRPVDRPPYWLFWSPWGTAWKRWQAEGMPAAFGDYGDVRASFGAEAVPRVVGVNCGPCPYRGRVVLEESDDYVTVTDSWGIKRRDYKGGMSMPQFLEFPVKNGDDWRAYRDRWLRAADPRRLEGDWPAQCRAAMREGRPLQLGYFPDVGVFGTVRWLLGDEECLIAFIDQADLVRDIMEHMTDLWLAVFERVVAAGVRVDVIHLWEDMCGRQGPLISPAMWREFMGPCYRRIKAFAGRNDIPLLSVDTDGRPDLIVPPMMAAGVNFVWPWEVAAGCDVNAVRAKYPTLGLMGGIDKRALAAGPDAIDRELARVRPAVQAGRYIPDLDHLVPDDVSWPNFQHYARGLKKLLEADNKTTLQG
jgi:uroporphyrinogen decarboxylase